MTAELAALLRLPRSGGLLPNETIDWEKARPLADAVQEWTDSLSGRLRTVFWLGAGIPLQGPNLVPSLVRIARERGLEDAILWVERLLQLRSTPARINAEVYGLKVPVGVTSVNNVNFMQFTELSDSPQNRYFKSAFDVLSLSSFRLPPDAVAFVDLDSVPIEEENEHVVHKGYAIQNAVRIPVRVRCG